MKPNETRAILPAAGGVEFALPLRSGLLCGLLVTGSAGLLCGRIGARQAPVPFIQTNPAGADEGNQHRPAGQRRRRPSPSTLRQLFQIEMDLVSYGYDRDRFDSGVVRSESFAYVPINLKAGLLHNLDLQVVLPGYASTRAHDFGQRIVDEHRGFGDVVVRTKYNLWGTTRVRPRWRSCRP